MSTRAGSALRGFSTASAVASKSPPRRRRGWPSLRARAGSAPGPRAAPAPSPHPLPAVTALAGRSDKAPYRTLPSATPALGRAFARPLHNKRYVNLGGLRKWSASDLDFGDDAPEGLRGSPRRPLLPRAGLPPDLQGAADCALPLPHTPSRADCRRGLSQQRRPGRASSCARRRCGRPPRRRARGAPWAPNGPGARDGVATRAVVTRSPSQQESAPVLAGVKSPTHSSLLDSGSAPAQSTTVGEGERMVGSGGSDLVREQSSGPGAPLRPPRPQAITTAARSRGRGRRRGACRVAAARSAGSLDAGEHGGSFDSARGTAHHSDSALRVAPRPRRARGPLRPGGASWTWRGWGTLGAVSVASSAARERRRAPRGGGAC